DDGWNIRAEGALDQKREALALALLPSERVDDHEVGALIDGACDPGAGIEQLADVQPAAGRAGAEILKQLQFLAGIDQHRGQSWRIDAMVAGLHEACHAISAGLE